MVHSSWEQLPSSDRDHALEVAFDAIQRRARVLEAADPHVAAALRHMAADLENRFPVAADGECAA